MALGSTKHLTEMSIRNVSQEYRWPVRGADLTTFMRRLSRNSGTLRVCAGFAVTLLPTLRMNVEKDRMILTHKSVKWLIYTTKKLDFQFYTLRSLDAECLDESRCIVLQCITETISRTCCAQVITSTIQWTL